MQVAGDACGGVKWYAGGPPPEGATPVHTNPEVQELLRSACEQLEALGAEIVTVTDFPAVTGYENPALLPEGNARLPEDWNSFERGPLVAHGWEKFLKDNADPAVPILSAIDEMDIWPHAMRTEAELAHLPPGNAIHWGKLAGHTKEFSFYETPKLEQALRALEDMRRQLLDRYLDEHKCHCFVFPSQGDVARADSDVNPESAAHAWKNGVWYSNGNRALRHLGIPSVTVPMGLIESKAVPVGLTFAGRAYDDVRLLQWANAFERHTQLRTIPIHTPALNSDVIHLIGHTGKREAPPILTHVTCNTTPLGVGCLRVMVEGSVEIDDDFKSNAMPTLEVVVNGRDVPQEEITLEKLGSGGCFKFKATTETAAPREWNSREKTMVPVARDKTMVVVLTRVGQDGYPAGHLALV